MYKWDVREWNENQAESRIEFLNRIESEGCWEIFQICETTDFTEEMVPFVGMRVYVVSRKKA